MKKKIIEQRKVRLLEIGTYVTVNFGARELGGGKEKKKPKAVISIHHNLTQSPVKPN